jgi:RNA polymerase sigma factor (TIGR02999 family)
VPKSEVSRVLSAMRAGDEDAFERLVPLVYQELRTLAAAQLRREHPGHTLHPTELVHEAYVRLRQGDAGWENRAHFFGAAARAMRRVLVDHARKRSARKRGGEVRRVTLGDLGIPSRDPELELLALDEALTALAAEHERHARLVELRYFAGCSIAHTAEVLGVSPATVKRDWAFARAWLHARIDR